nr:MAG TPA: hypothetical protein [Caudoviricetes sp.]
MPCQDRQGVVHKQFTNLFFSYLLTIRNTYAIIVLCSGR